MNQVIEKPAPQLPARLPTLRRYPQRSSKPTAANVAKNSAAPAVTKSTVPFHAKVNDMAFSRDAWYAATEDGLLVSRDHGLNWRPASL